MSTGRKPQAVRQGTTGGSPIDIFTASVGVLIFAMLMIAVGFIAIDAGAQEPQGDDSPTAAEVVAVQEGEDAVFPETPQGEPWILPTPLLIALVVGILLPPIQAFITKPDTDPAVKFVAAIGLALIATFVQLWSQGFLDLAIHSGDWVRVGLITIIASQASFPRWKNSQIVPRLEERGPNLIT